MSRSILRTVKPLLALAAMIVCTSNAWAQTSILDRFDANAPIGRHEFLVTTADAEIRAVDSLVIRADVDCLGTCLTIEMLSGDTLRLRSLRLEDTVNAKIISIDPFPFSDAFTVRVCIAPINPDIDASATVVIKDMPGNATRIPFIYIASKLEATPTSLSFGAVRSDTRDTLALTLTNPIARAEIIRRFAHSDSAFRIIDPPALPLTLASRDSITILVEVYPRAPNAAYVDTLWIDYCCSRMGIPLRAETADPCVMMGDLDFGLLRPGASRALSLRISNVGGETITFVNPSGGAVLEWRSDRFVVSAADLSRLSAARLGRDEYIDVTVTFSAPELGHYYSDTARLWASTRNCRDTSIWVARVDAIGAAAEEIVLETALHGSHPNPTTGRTDIRFSLAEAGHTTLVLYDALGGRIATLLDENRTSGTHVVRVDATSLAAGVYHYRLVVGGVGRSGSFIRQ